MIDLETFNNKFEIKAENYDGFKNFKMHVTMSLMCDIWQTYQFTQQRITLYIIEISTSILS